MVREQERVDLGGVGKVRATTIHEYSARDVILYHLGIGVGPEDLDFVYEGVRVGPKVCPSFAVVPLFEPMRNLLAQLRIPFRTVLHGEQTILMDDAIPPKGMFITTATAPAIYDKGKAAVVVFATETTDKAGKRLFRARMSLFCRGLGGFGGDPGPGAPPLEIPQDKPPDFEWSQRTAHNQAALYRLSGDLNPLHIDPLAASFAGFRSPILHGLCTFGFVGRAILREVCQDDIGRFAEFGVRFSAPVYPGDTITTRGWGMGGGLYHLRVATERGEVLSNAYARVRED